MKKKWFIFALGLIFFLFSSPVSIRIIMEITHNSNFHARYDMKTVSEVVLVHPSPTDYSFYGTTINTSHIEKDTKYTIDDWDNKLVTSDILITINETTIETLKDFKVRINDEGFAKYYGNVEYWLVTDKVKNEKSFIIVMKKTNIDFDTVYDITDAHLNQLEFRTYTVSTDGKIKKQDFSFTDRDPLQTKLMFGISPIGVGYYTNDLHSMPSLFFPILYPFGIWIIGLILLFYSIPLIVLKKQSWKSEKKH
ncbi:MULTISPECIES: hypothetical protein [Bacillus cereus group]|uniref:Uncharacterized protein n=1 Tax=Bacillus cereus TaxID=1396 RepID=A0AA44QAH6_BACCE|nr:MULTISPECIES: hypothetical protein [Bacillus cereus group]PFA17741.1 hypothetical protein CN373_20000 [Bacillus cereus]PFN07265.1 hypothetical protein COJ55_11310 [Bacillus cereus]PFO78032.1 hypothetical protein COJ77_21320 [Bacillus cereus]PFR27454.1 hypothetical protein COK19_10415 [Bacillus cereus]PFS01372.1 hypothetical protein COK38_11850 [Bacillus cereus]